MTETIKTQIRQHQYQQKQQHVIPNVMPYGRKLYIPPTNYHLLAVQQEPYKNKS